MRLQCRNISQSADGSACDSQICKQDISRLVEISGRGRQDDRKMQPGKETVTQRMGRVSENGGQKERESHTLRKLTKQ